MAPSPWQSVCLVLLGAILAVWVDEGSTDGAVECLGSTFTTTVDGNNAASGWLNAGQPVTVTENKRATPSEQQMFLEAEERWNEAVEHFQGAALNYLRDPKGFIERFQNCVNDPHCYIMYHHVSKTGGMSYSRTRVAC